MPRRRSLVSLDHDGLLALRRYRSHFHDDVALDRQQTLLQHAEWQVLALAPTSSLSLEVEVVVVASFCSPHQALDAYLSTKDGDRDEIICAEEAVETAPWICVKAQHIRALAG